MTTSPLFENAVDSLDLAIHFLLHSDRHTAQKHAVLNSFHAVELLLKERLHQAHPLLVFEKVGGSVDDDARTVGVREAYSRLRNAGVELDEQDWKDLRSLQKHRNRIEHRHFDPDPAHKLLTRKALNFIFRFVRDHLEEDLSEWLDEQVYAEAREQVLSHQQMLEDAKKKLRELGVEGEAECCPECGEETFIITDDFPNNGKCTYCLNEYEVESCDSCGRYGPVSVLHEWGMCDDCFEHQVARF